MASSFDFVRAGVIGAAAGACLAACASQPPPAEHGRLHGHGGGRGWQGGRERGGSVNLFISPAGQPFRAAAEDPYPVVQWFAAADANRDGRISRTEFREDARRFFEQLDANHDGVIDGAEVIAYEHAVAPEILASLDRAGGPPPGAQGRWSGGQGRRGGGHRGGGHRDGASQAGGPGSARLMTLQGAAPYSLLAQAEPVTAADTDFDGKVSLQEFLAAADRHFAELDKAGAGFLSLETLPATPVQRRRLDQLTPR